MEISEVLNTVRQAFSKDCRIPAVRVHVLSNAMLMGSAKLESYVEGFISDWVARVNAAGVVTNEIPNSLRAHFFNQQGIITTYRNFVVNGDENALNGRTVNLIDSNSVRFLLNGQPLPAMNAGWILYERKYPSPDNWTALFRRLGIPHVFHALNAEAHANVEMLLTSYNDVRSELAHEGIPPGMSVSDIRARLIDIKKIVSWLDRVLFRHCGVIAGLDVWTTR